MFSGYSGNLWTVTPHQNLPVSIVWPRRQYRLQFATDEWTTVWMYVRMMTRFKRRDGILDTMSACVEDVCGKSGAEANNVEKFVVNGFSIQVSHLILLSSIW